jgi:hypothetical protein
MVYEYPFWEEILVEEDGLEVLNITLTEIDNEIDGLESLDELNFNLTEIEDLEDLNFNLIELIGLENLGEENNINNKRKRFILID